MRVHFHAPQRVRSPHTCGTSNARLKRRQSLFLRKPCRLAAGMQMSERKVSSVLAIYATHSFRKDGSDDSADNLPSRFGLGAQRLRSLQRAKYAFTVWTSSWSH